MRRIMHGVLLLLGIVAAGSATLATSGSRVSPTRQWAIVNFARTTQVSGYLLDAGQYLIVHDFDKMDRGEPCTSFYSFGESGSGPQQEVLAFHCIPRDRPVVDHTTLDLKKAPGDTAGCTWSWSWEMDKLTEYQFAGDAEGHGVPEGAIAAPLPAVPGPHVHGARCFDEACE